MIIVYATIIVAVLIADKGLRDNERMADVREVDR